MDKRLYEPKEFPLNELKGKCGVYQIRNRVNGKLYIGSSANLKDRLKDHLGYLTRNKHSNPKLQHSFNKYGVDNFIFEIIEFCKKDEQFILEQYWIDYFIGENCFNINPVASNPPNCKGKKFIRSKEHCKHLSDALKIKCQDPEFRKKMSEVRMGKHTGLENANSKSVVCLETSKIYESASLADKAYGWAIGTVSSCCRGERKTALGTHWLFKEDYDKLSEEEINEIIFTQNRSKQVVCLETRKMYGKIIEAAADVGVWRDSIVDCCNGKMVEAEGTHWVYYEDFKRMTEEKIQNKLKQHTTSHKRCRCLDTGQIFNSATEAEKVLKLPKGKVSVVCRGKRNMTGGYHFEYIND